MAVNLWVLRQLVHRLSLILECLLLLLLLLYGHSQQILRRHHWECARIVITRLGQLGSLQVHHLRLVLFNLSRFKIGMLLLLVRLLLELFFNAIFGRLHGVGRNWHLHFGWLSRRSSITTLRHVPVGLSALCEAASVLILVVQVEVQDVDLIRLVPNTDGLIVSNNCTVCLFCSRMERPILLVLVQVRLWHIIIILLLVGNLLLWCLSIQQLLVLHFTLESGSVLRVNGWLAVLAHLHLL